MSKQQAILETLLGAAELKHDRRIAISIRNDIFKITHSHEADGYQRLARAGFGAQAPTLQSRLNPKSLGIGLVAQLDCLFRSLP